MVKIKVSYSEQSELQNVIKLLAPIIYKVKKSRNVSNGYHIAHILTKKDSNKQYQDI